MVKENVKIELTSHEVGHLLVLICAELRNLRRCAEKVGLAEKQGMLSLADSYNELLKKLLKDL